MANPSPQHNPTDGLGVAAVVLCTATPVALTKVGSQVARSAGTTPGGHQYACTLSIANSDTTTVTAILTDVKGTTYTTVGSPVFKAYCRQSAPSRPGTTGNPDIVATVDSSSGLITGIAVGQTIVEVQFPTFDNTEGADTNTGNPKDMVYSQIIVTVTP